jgi:hypothetical protein
VLIVEIHFGNEVRYADKWRYVREEQRLVVNVTKVFFPVRVDVNSVVVLYIVYMFVVVVDSGNIGNFGNFGIFFIFQRFYFFF